MVPTFLLVATTVKRKDRGMTVANPDDRVANALPTRVTASSRESSFSVIAMPQTCSLAE